MRYVTASQSKFSLNLSTEEVCFGEEKFSLPFKDKVVDEKKLAQRGKFETMTIGRDHQSWWLSYKKLTFMCKQICLSLNKLHFIYKNVKLVRQPPSLACEPNWKITCRTKLQTKVILLVPQLDLNARVQRHVNPECLGSSAVIVHSSYFSSQFQP